MFQGSFVALVTPFKDGKVDDQKLMDLVEWQISEGTNGLVPVGTTGESATLSHEEHAHVIDVVVRAARKRVPVIAGAGSNSTEEAIRLTKEAKQLGADAVLSVNPYYNKPTQAGLAAHFSAIAQSVDIPIILYNIPSRSGVNLSVETIEKLAADQKNIVGVKEATGSMDHATAILSRTPPEFCLLSGDDSVTLPIISLGGRGVISVVANIVPKDIQKLCAAALSKNFDDARKMNLKLYPLIKALFIETNPAPVKAAMVELGLLERDNLRLPMVPVNNESREKIKGELKKYGVSAPLGVK